MEALLDAAVDDLEEWFRPTSRILPEWIPTPARRRVARASSSSRVDAVAEQLLTDAEASDEGLLALLQEMSRQGEGALTGAETTSQLRTFLFAGHETTAATVSFALQLLSERPEIEARFHDEVDSVVADRTPKLADLEALDVVDGVVRETRRLYPPAFSQARVAADDVDIGGYLVDAGTDVLVYTAVAHRDERFWDDPPAFRPDGWTDTDPESTGFEYVVQVPAAASENGSHCWRRA